MIDGSKQQPIIVFDFGGVLIDWNPRHLYRKLFPGESAAMERFLSEINFYEWNHEQDKGRPFSEGVAILSKQHPHYAALIAAFAERWEETLAGPIAETVDVLRQLKAQGYPLFGLTNWSAETFRRIRPKYDFLSWFDDIVVSGEVGLAKPDPAIYEILLEAANATADQCLFIDDSAANVRAAERMGFTAIRYESPGQLQRELSSYGLQASERP